jgi:hypothetical protein
MNLQLLILQLIAHILSDYFFQNDESAKEKNENGFKSKTILKHILITFLCSYIVSFDINFIFCSIGISFFHYLIDGFKKTFNTSKFGFFIDQFAHFLTIILFVWLFDKYFVSNRIINFLPSCKWLFAILSYLICFKPVNIIIREILIVAKIADIPFEGGELENAGKLIGILERILVLTFVIVGEIEVIGFLIAAKTILRYKDTDTTKSEYVLIGTMISFGIAMLFGLTINRL